MTRAVVELARDNANLVCICVCDVHIENIILIKLRLFISSKHYEFFFQDEHIFRMYLIDH